MPNPSKEALSTDLLLHAPPLPPHPQLQEAPWSPVFSLTLRSCRLGGKECRISDVCCEQVVRVDSCCCPSLAFLRLLQGQA